MVGVQGLNPQPVTRNQKTENQYKKNRQDQQDFHKKECCTLLANSRLVPYTVYLIPDLYHVNPVNPVRNIQTDTRNLATVTTFNQDLTKMNHENTKF